MTSRTGLGRPELSTLFAGNGPDVLYGPYIRKNDWKK